MAVFRDPKYRHVSGIIYTSQSSRGLIPGNYGWHNYGVTFVPNPMATNPIDIQFPFFRTTTCTEEKYEELEAVEPFTSRVLTS